MRYALCVQRDLVEKRNWRIERFRHRATHALRRAGGARREDDHPPDPGRRLGQLVGPGGHELLDRRVLLLLVGVMPGDESLPAFAGFLQEAAELLVVDDGHGLLA